MQQQLRNILCLKPAELPKGLQRSGRSGETEEAGDGGEQQLGLPDPGLRKDSRYQFSSTLNLLYLYYALKTANR